MVEGHKIREKVEVEKFLEYVWEYKKEDIEPTSHTFFRLSEKQRNIYTKSFIQDIILNETPILTGIQNNNLWAIFYKHEKDILRIILDIQPDKIYIVTFYIINEEQIPRI